MIYALIALVAALGIIIFHWLNLARFTRVIFNQVAMVGMLSKQSRAVNTIKNWLILLARLSLVGCLAYFVFQEKFIDKQAIQTRIFIPKLSRITVRNLHVIDSVVSRSNQNGDLAVYSNDRTLMDIFPGVIRFQETPGPKSDQFAIDSIQLDAGGAIPKVQFTDSAILVNARGKDFTGRVNGAPIEFNGASVQIPNGIEEAEVVLSNAPDWPLYAIRSSAPLHVNVTQDQHQGQLLKVVESPHFKVELKQENANLLLGSAFKDKVTSKSVFYIPADPATLAHDFELLGVSSSVTKAAENHKDTFNIFEPSFFSYATPSGQLGDVSVTGTPLFTISGYSIPVIYNGSNRALVYNLPNKNGNQILFVNANPFEKNGLASSELFLPLLLSLNKDVSRSGLLRQFDLCNKKDQTALRELAAASDSILYNKGVANNLLTGRFINKIEIPGIYHVYKSGSYAGVAVNQTSCGGLPSYYYVQRSRASSQENLPQYAILALLLTFVAGEGVLALKRL